MNGIQSSFEDLDKDKIQNTIDIEPNVETTIYRNGGHANYMNSGSEKKGIDFYDNLN